MEGNKKKTGTHILNEKEWYREKAVEIINLVEDEAALKKIYTFAKILKDMLNEKEGG